MKKILISFILAVLLINCSASLPKEAEFVPGEIIVKFKNKDREGKNIEFISPSPHSTSSIQAAGSTAPPKYSIKMKVDNVDQEKISSKPSVNELLKNYKAKRLHKLFKGFDKPEDQTRLSQKTENRFAVRTARAPKIKQPVDLTNIYKIEVDPAETKAAVAAFSADKENVEYAEPNYIYEINAVPNDPYFNSSNSWGQGYDDLWGLKKISAEAAWDTTTGSSDVVVAVVDTGLDYNHEDIVGNVWLNSDEIADNGVDDDGNGFVDDVRGWDFVSDDNDPLDGHGHGSHVSGTISGIGNNNKGIVGVTWFSKIMPLKGLPDRGKGTVSALSSAIIYATVNGADVVNMSFGGRGRSIILENALNYAHNHGAVLVAAAGNDNADANNYSPASHYTAITVSSTTHRDDKSVFSNWGSKIDVAAPGGNSPSNILSLRSSLRTSETDVVGSNYLRMKGTSMAAPHVSGLAALLLSKTPAFSNEQVRQIIRTTSDDLGARGWDPFFGYGRINAFRAIRANSSCIAKISSPEVAMVTRGLLEISGSAAVDNFNNFISYMIFIGSGDNPANWDLLYRSTSQVNNDLLYQLNTVQYNDGIYIVKLVVTYSSNNRLIEDIEDRVKIIINNHNTTTTTTTTTTTSSTTTTTSPFAELIIEEFENGFESWRNIGGSADDVDWALSLQTPSLDPHAGSYFALLDTPTATAYLELIGTI